MDKTLETGSSPLLVVIMITEGHSALEINDSYKSNFLFR